MDNWYSQLRLDTKCVCKMKDCICCMYTYTHKCRIFDCALVDNIMHLAFSLKDFSIDIHSVDKSNKKIINLKHHYMYITNIKYYTSSQQKTLLITSSRDSRFFVYDCKDKYKILQKINNGASISCFQIWFEDNKDIITVSTWISLHPLRQYDLLTGEKIKEIDCNTCWYFSSTISPGLFDLLKANSYLTHPYSRLIIVSHTPMNFSVLDLDKGTHCKDSLLLRTAIRAPTSSTPSNANSDKKIDLIKKMLSGKDYLIYYETNLIDDPYCHFTHQSDSNEKHYNIRKHPIINNKLSNLTSSSNVKQQELVLPLKPQFRNIENMNSNINPLINEKNFVNTYQVKLIKTDGIVEKTEVRGTMLFWIERSGKVTVSDLIAGLEILAVVDLQGYNYDMMVYEGGLIVCSGEMIGIIKVEENVQINLMSLKLVGRYSVEKTDEAVVCFAVLNKFKSSFEYNENDDLNCEAINFLELFNNIELFGYTESNKIIKIDNLLNFNLIN